MLNLLEDVITVRELEIFQNGCHSQNGRLSSDAETYWGAGKNNRGRYRACRPRPMTLNYQIFRWMWCIFQIWWVLGYVQASKTEVIPQKNSVSFNYNRDHTGLQPAQALTRTVSSYEWGPSPPPTHTHDLDPAHRRAHGSWPQRMMGKSEDTGQRLSCGIRCNGKCTGSAKGWMCSKLDLLY